MKTISDYLSGDCSISELAGAYGVSRKTVYKWTCRRSLAAAVALRRLTCVAKAPEGWRSPNALQLTEMAQNREASGLRAVYRLFRAPKDCPFEPTLSEKNRIPLTGPDHFANSCLAGSGTEL